MISQDNNIIGNILQQRRIAALATENPDGSIHLVSVWFLFEDTAFYITTPSWSRKGKNLLHRPNATIMVDVRGSYSEKGISASGDAIILKDPESNHIKQKIFQRYVSKTGLADPKVGPPFFAANDLTIKIEPKIWIDWDMSVLDEMAFDGRLRSQSYLLDLDI